MNYHDIKKCDMLNGEGIRVSLWVAGCEHNCSQCQNPQTWDINSGIPFDEDAEKELFETLKKPHTSGITFTGGDPLHSDLLQDVLNLVNKIRILFGKSKTIWLYSGYTWEEIWTPKTRIDVSGEKVVGWTIEQSIRQDILSQCDVFIDGRYIDSQRDITLKWRGSSNQRVVDVQKTINEGKIVLYEI